MHVKAASNKQHRLAICTTDLASSSWHGVVQDQIIAILIPVFVTLGTAEFFSFRYFQSFAFIVRFSILIFCNYALLSSRLCFVFILLVWLAFPPVCIFRVCNSGELLLVGLSWILCRLFKTAISDDFRCPAMRHSLLKIKANSQSYFRQGSILG